MIIYDQGHKRVPGPGIDLFTPAGFSRDSASGLDPLRPSYGWPSSPCSCCFCRFLLPSRDFRPLRSSFPGTRAKGTRARAALTSYFKSRHRIYRPGTRPGIFIGPDRLFSIGPVYLDAFFITVSSRVRLGGTPMELYEGYDDLESLARLAIRVVLSLCGEPLGESIGKCRSLE